jgi:hypothetical protein
VAKRTEPENVIVDFFTNIEANTARTVFAIVKGIVDRRGLLQKRKKAAKAKDATKDATPNRD